MRGGEITRFVRRFFVFTALVVVSSQARSAWADSLGTYGDVAVIGGDYQLTATKNPVGYAGVYYTAPANQVLSDITQLSADYEMTAGTFNGGAPRFSLWDTTNNPNNEAYVYWGAPQVGGTFTDPNYLSNTLNNTGNFANLASSDVRVYSNGFGGLNTPNTGMTWASFVAAEGNVPLGYISVDLDGGWAAGTQVMLLNNININGKVYTAPAPVPLPEAAWTGLLILGGFAVCSLGLKRLHAVRPVSAF
jgi:hypothetical protein